MRKLIFILFIGIFLLSFDNIVFSKDTQNFDYVIITTDELVDSLSNFTEWKQSLGYNVKIVTISWIESNYNGKDIQEKIRNFLIDKYEEWGIDYVLIAGSRDKIPMRKCYLNPSNHEDKYSIIETDYYYADLTGNWDADRDGYFGEIMQDKPDFYPEIYVGRIPSDDANKIRNICQHIINFEKSNKTWKKDVLLLGAIIFYENYSSPWGLSNKKVDANPPQITIQQPENGIYIFGNKIFPFLFPLLIGKTDIKAIAWDENGIERVEFYMDNSLRASIENEPYEWKYHAIGFYKIKVVAIDGNGNRGGKEIEVFSLYR